MNNVLCLKYAIEIEKTGSISKAADNLFMGQPHLSKAIRELEESLGIIIFKRSSKGVVPTEKGREFLAEAKSIIAQLDELEDRYTRGSGKSNTFEISVPRASYLSDVFISFLNSGEIPPDMSVDWHETSSVSAICNVADGINDIAVIRFQSNFEDYFKRYIDSRDLKLRELKRFQPRVVTADNGRFSNSENVTLSELASGVEIVHGDFLIPTLSAAKTKELIRESSVSKRRISVYERASQLELLSNIPDTYMWVSPVPEHVLKRYSLSEFACVERNILFVDALIYRDGYVLSDTEKIFVRFLEEKLRQF